MMAALPAIEGIVKAIIGLIIFVTVIALFLYFYESIICYFTKKEDFGVIVSSDCSCKSGAHGLWNDKSGKNGKMCCRTPNWQNDFAKAWCIDMEIGDSCMNDWQCQSGYCSPGQTGDSKCEKKLLPGEEMEFNRAWTGCTTGASGLWNDQFDKNKARCCPTKDWQNNFSNSWCVKLANDSECIWDFQCISGYCAPGKTKESICALKQKTGIVGSWFRPDACESGTAARWNDKGPFPEERCCPTQRWVNNWGKGWCIELPNGSSCLFDGQCVSKSCLPGDTADSVCKVRRPSYEVTEWWRGNLCVSGAAGLWNDRVSNPQTRCCPTQNKVNNWAQGWCIDLPTGSECIFNDQCLSKRCSHYLSADGKCT